MSGNFEYMAKYTAKTERVVANDEGKYEPQPYLKNVRVTPLMPVGTKRAEQMQLQSWSKLYEIFTDEDVITGDILIMNNKRYTVVEAKAHELHGKIYRVAILADREA